MTHTMPTPGSNSAGPLPERKKSLNFNPDVLMNVPMPKVASPFDSKETRVEKV